MNQDSILKWTNRTALFSITLLVYWTFIYIAITVFDFKVFRENMTQTFYMSVMGILALMFGAIVVNVMYNLTKISAAISGEHTDDVLERKIGKKVVLFFLSFPVIFALLFFGDHMSTKKKEVRIKNAARMLVDENQEIVRQLVNYQFEYVWREAAADHLKMFRAIDESFPCVQLIVKDRVDGEQVFLSFASYFNYKSEKVDHIHACSAGERAFLIRAFDGDLSQLFSSNGSKYELYHPVEIDGKIIVLYLSDWQRYGKFGS